ncbi:MAG TPA: hypothetical protein VK973_06730 [Arenicellales bacterium]|nr:hypothetical protein [Arenicellales bacterium]
MKVDIVVHPHAPHQRTAGEALAAGMARHGDEARIITHSVNARADIAVCWGWRTGRRLRDTGRRVLVMERGYVGDRFLWTSLGWDGLNGRARFPFIDDGGARWRECFEHLLQPEREGGEYVLMLGQVKGDASLEKIGVADHWYAKAAHEIGQRLDLPVKFRPHPVQVERDGPPRSGQLYGMELIQGSLDEALAGAVVAVAWNSNSLTEAALAGVRVIACDPGAMVWPIAGQGMDADPCLRGREAWAHRLAWCQWARAEIENGAAWEAVKAAMPTTVPTWSDIEAEDRWLDAFA